jgi:hypothetical protein
VFSGQPLLLLGAGFHRRFDLKSSEAGQGRGVAYSLLDLLQRLSDVIERLRTG